MMTPIIHIYLRRIFARCQADKQAAQARKLIAKASEPTVEAKRVRACRVGLLHLCKVWRRRSTASGARGRVFLGVSECRAEVARSAGGFLARGGVSRFCAGRKNRRFW